MQMISLGALLEKHHFNDEIHIYSRGSYLGRVRWEKDGSYKLPEYVKAEDRITHQSFRIIRSKQETRRKYFLYI